MIAKEIEIRAAISQICLEWIGGTQFVPGSTLEGHLFWLRFHHADAFGSWFWHHGLYFRGKTQDQILSWLLIDFWERVSLTLWRADPEKLQPYSSSAIKTALAPLSN